ncbi:MAG: hypothetical protein SPD95_11645 [Candidatus Faecousia sp.]|nr:hypothetical protein [Candidatus Faecousia sp.]
MAFTFVPYQKKEYQQSQNVTNAQNALQQHQQNKPGDYQSQWQGQIDDLLKQYQSRGPFQYDINADAMYQQLLDRYVQQGQQAMMDTMGQAAALTGGYGNSYAQSVGQQTYQGYLQGAYDMMPQFYQMALDRYQMEGDDLLSQYGLLSDQEDRAYGQYMDMLNQYYAQLDRLQGAYESERDYDFGKYQYDESFDYNTWMDDQEYQYKADRDAVADDQWRQQMEFQREQARLEAERWQKEYEERIRQYNESMAWQREQAAMAAAANNNSGSGSGSYARNNSTLPAAKSSAKTSAIINGLGSADTWASRGVTRKEYNAMVRDRINNSDLSDAEVLYLLQYYGLA